MYLTAEEDAAIYGALPKDLQPHFAVSVNTGLRWSEQMSLRWKNVDFLTRMITVTRSKHGQARTVPMNSTVRSVLWTWPASVTGQTIRRRLCSSAAMPKPTSSLRRRLSVHRRHSEQLVGMQADSTGSHGTAT